MIELDDATGFNKLLGKHLRDITLLIGLLQIVFALLAAYDRLNPTVPSHNPFLEILVDDSFWAGIFLGSGCTVLISMKNVPLRAHAMAFTSAAMLVWGLLCFMKSITAITPVALSLAIVVFALGALSVKLNMMWNLLTLNPERL